MTEIMTGGCQCGAVRYEIRGTPLSLYACHCTECQKQSGSAFAMSMPVPRKAFVVTKGKLKEWRVIADSGREKICTFCENCGTRIYHAPGNLPTSYTVKPGTLDDTSGLRIVGHIWTKSAQPWVKIEDSPVNCTAQPESFDGLFEAWRTARD